MLTVAYSLMGTVDIMKSNCFLDVGFVRFPPPGRLRQMDWASSSSYTSLLGKYWKHIWSECETGDILALKNESKHCHIIYLAALNLHQNIC